MDQNFPIEPSNSRAHLQPGQFVIWLGHAVLVTEREGRICAGAEGFFLHHTRFLSRLRFMVDGAEATFVSATPIGQRMLSSYHVAPSPAGAAAAGPADDGSKGGGEIGSKAIEIQVNAYVGGGLHFDVHVTNHGLCRTTVALGWAADADFADQDDAKPGSGRQPGLVERRWEGAEGDGTLTLRDRHSGLGYATMLRFAGADEAFATGDGAVTRFDLRVAETRHVSLDVVPQFRGEAIEPLYGLDGVPLQQPAPESAREEWMAGCARLACPDAAVQTCWEQAASDLGSLLLLEGDGDARFLPAAGMPRYSGMFGRDALVAGWQSALLNPLTLRGALTALAPWVATETDDRYDAQPGKVLHQRQLGPKALLGKTPFIHYYGDHSAPMLFLLGAATDLAWTGDVAFFRGIEGKLRETLAWMDRDGDLDGDGFYEYRTRAGEHGLKNQAWKDSGQAVLEADGTMVADPIAMCEIQGLAFAAKQALGLAYAALGEPARAHDLLAQAAELKRRFNARYWMADAGTFAMALGPDKRQVRSIGSDPASCLAYGIVDDARAQSVAARAMAPDMFSGWGVRTLSAEHPCYNPLAYHLGSVWPANNSAIAFGFKRYGLIPELHRLARAQFEASRLFEYDRLPEVFGGHPRDRRHPHPGLYPGACAPQAWSSGAVILLVHAMLGLTPLAPRRTLMVDPDLPEWLPELTLRDLRLGEATLSLRFARGADGAAGFEILDNPGGLRVLRCAAGPGTGDRLPAAIRAAGA